MILPALVEASIDGRLRGSPLNVYVWLICHRLDCQEYRSLKIEGLAVSLRMKDDTLRRALKLLVTCGYLERRYLPREGHAYRLRMTRAA